MRNNATCITCLLALLEMLIAGCAKQPEPEPANKPTVNRQGTSTTTPGEVAKTNDQTSNEQELETSGSADTAAANSAEEDSPGRELTEWVLSKGGSVSAYVDKKSYSWDQPEELPSGNIEPHRINLEGVVIADEDMKRFAGQPKLQYLHLNQSSVTDKGLANLSDLPNLETLQLVGTKITDAGLQSLQQVPSVQQLYLSNTSIGDAGLATLREMPALTVLWLANTEITDAGLIELGKIKTLFNLNLQGTKITDQGLPALSGLKSLNRCDLRNTSVSEAAAKALDEDLPNGTVSSGS